MKIPEIVTEHVSSAKQLTEVSENILKIEGNKIDLNSGKPRKQQMILVTGLSGSGKDTVIDELITQNPKLEKILTMTTRLRREGESIEYDPQLRATREEFITRRENGEFIETNDYAGNYYGSPKSEVLRILEAGKIPVLRIDPSGMRRVIELWVGGDEFLKDFDLKYFFIIPESWEILRNRLIARGDSEDEVVRRLEQSRIDATFLEDAQYIVINREGAWKDVAKEIYNLFRL